MLSRIGESLYWMSRYLERAGNTARLIEINLLHLLEAEDALPEGAQWRPLLSISGSEELYAFIYEGAPIGARRAIQFMTSARQNSNSIRNSLRMSRENARVVRDRISKEMWESLNELWLRLDRQMQGPLLPESGAAVYGEVRSGVAHFHGVALSTMMRNEAFGFYLLGTCLERADMTARILDVKYHLLLPDIAMVGSPLDYYQWAALLKSLSGFEAYRRHYHAGMRPVDVAEFTIFEAEFPRSLRYSTDRMRQALQQIGTAGPDSRTANAMDALMGQLGESNAETVVAKGMHEFLERFLERIADLDAALKVEYFDVYLGEGPCAS
jgi:uncharacterized alpha-E superfamily protein